VIFHSNGFSIVINDIRAKSEELADIPSIEIWIRGLEIIAAAGV
jgi:hypothetical protein